MTSKNINAEQTQILGNLVETAGTEFSYDWLEKNDPDNYILGKLCSCCAHLEGVGNGIMHASMIHPNVQNLVIRDRKGDIVAKSTLYINPEEGYGVFNNVEVWEELSDKDYDAVYEKYILGVREFIKAYNKLHPDKPIRKMNVGMNLNDLETQIRWHHPSELMLLDAIKYGQFCEYDLSYDGDSDEDQRILWQEGEELQNKNEESQGLE